ncbi:MAG: DUF3048 domain-containing protein [Candidatus Levybacteria bacterium]|nr:DUF3048 domain-containing protein [Candidatus Levybacteria bacterium]
MDKRKITIIFLTIIVYILSTGISYALFSKNPITSQVNVSSPLQSTPKDTTGRITFDQNLPKTEPCPLNGVMYSSKQKQWWEQHRPLGIMIENHENARPQSGISAADVVYEAVAEGGITRFLTVFYCQDGGQVGPVRSARTYFLDFISEYGANPLYVHVGGANTPGPADALSQINDYEWGGYNDLNQFAVGFPTFWRDYNRLGQETATEHTMYSTTSKLWEYAKNQRKLTNVDSDGILWDKSFLPYSFKDDVVVSQRPEKQTINIQFWSGYKQYAVEWVYDKTKNTYLRNNGGVLHMDKDTNKTLTAKNIIVLSIKESNANDGYENNLHLLYKTKGSGKAQVFMDGNKINGTWRKDSRTSRTLIFDSSGDPIKFDRGNLWFEVLPLDGEIVVK